MPSVKLVFLKEYDLTQLKLFHPSNIQAQPLISNIEDTPPLSSHLEQLTVFWQTFVVFSVC